MGYQILLSDADPAFKRLAEEYDIFAPILYPGTGTFSDIDVIRYGQVHSLDEIVFDKKSDYSFKEALFPVNQTLFYYTEDQTMVPSAPAKERLIFLRSCDLHAVKRLDAMYLENGSPDAYYKALRDISHFVLMECPSTCSTGFCVSMESNQTEDYDLFLRSDGDFLWVDCKSEKLLPYFESLPAAAARPVPAYVEANKETVVLPKALSLDSYQDPIWEAEGGRCIGCGRCNFVCPTCTCFTMQDIAYKDNAKAGERRRIWASCQVDGYSDIAGGGSFRKSQGERMRFKVLHKVLDFPKRFGYTMCVGCGRCDAVCPEYISYANTLNKLSAKEEA